MRRLQPGKRQPRMPAPGERSGGPCRRLPSRSPLQPPAPSPNAHPSPLRSVQPPDGAFYLSGRKRSPAKKSLGCLAASPAKLVVGNAIYPLMFPYGISSCPRSVLARSAAPVLALHGRLGLLTIFICVLMQVSCCPGHRLHQETLGVQSSRGVKPANPALLPIEPLRTPEPAGAGAGDCSGRTSHPPDRGVQQRRSRNRTCV